MLTRIMGAALAAGVVAGLSTAVLQEAVTTPLIVAAEAYEGGGHDHHAAAALRLGAGDDVARVWLAHGHAAEAAAAPTLERSAFTAVSTIALAFGFALMLLAAMILSGARITAREGLAWGAAAFVVTGLAPALGLPPELPGSAAGALEDRQIWWLATACATAGGLWLALRGGTPAALAIGLGLIVAPHAIGAPAADGFASTAPAELAGHFAAASLSVHAALWAAVGASVGWFWSRGDRPA